jgi:nucleoside-diphosphate-sugar epimerase
MDVVVAGGHGKIGLRLLRLLADGGHRGRGIVRNTEHV